MPETTYRTTDAEDGIASRGLTIKHTPALRHAAGKRLGALWKLDRADREVEYRCDLCKQTCDPVPVPLGFQFCQECLRRVQGRDYDLIPAGLDEGEKALRAAKLRLSYAGDGLTFWERLHADRSVKRALTILAVVCLLMGVVALMQAGCGR